MIWKIEVWIVKNCEMRKFFVIMRHIISMHPLTNMWTDFKIHFYFSEDFHKKTYEVKKEEECPKRHSFLKWNAKNKSIQLSLEKFYSVKTFFCWVDHVFQTFLRDVTPWILFGCMWPQWCDFEEFIEYLSRGFIWGLMLVLFWKIINPLF